MSHDQNRARPDYAMPIERQGFGGEAHQQPVLPMNLREGIREALEGQHGKLRMDPADLLSLIATAVQLEVTRLAQERDEYIKHRRTERILTRPALFFAPKGTAGINQSLEVSGDHE